jgi:hypothetical protein
VAQESRKVSDCAQVNSLSTAALILVFDTSNTVANTYLVSSQNLLANTPADHKVANGYNFVLKGSVSTPANSTANSTVEKGTVAWDSSYLYVATSNGHFKRAALSDF